VGYQKRRACVGVFPVRRACVGVLLGFPEPSELYTNLLENYLELELGHRQDVPHPLKLFGIQMETNLNFLTETATMTVLLPDRSSDHN
jgi:hypothetical protein